MAKPYQADVILPKFWVEHGKAYLRTWLGTFEVLEESFESTDGGRIALTLHLQTVPPPPVEYNTVDLELLSLKRQITKERERLKEVPW